MKDGEQNGIGVFYHENGKIRSIGAYGAKGTYVGDWKQYDSAGRFIGLDRYDSAGKFLKFERLKH